MRHWRLLVLATGLLAACGGNDTSGSTDTGPIESDTGAPPTDTTTSDSGAVTDTGTPPDTGTPVDTTPTDTTPADTTEPPTGSFGARCGGDADCDSNWCVAAPDGLRCSRQCLETCDDGWSCRGVTRTGEDITFICLHTTAALCHPCSDNKDCNFGVANASDLCVSYGDQGNFCGLSCEDDGDCPNGASCKDATTTSGAVAKQCVANDNTCECNGSAIQLELSTTCGVVNDFGTCQGARACGESGLSACAGAAASEEVCNGDDDDCSGVADDNITPSACNVENAAGVCFGLTACLDGAESCVGQPPSDEVCDGIDNNCNDATDEGFTDTDGDGQADCVDDDDDGDLTLDGQDCAPLDASRHLGATETCANAVDDDCDGKTNEQDATGCTDFLQDIDGDNFGSLVAPIRCLCAADPEDSYTVLPNAGGDCDDLTDTTFPNANETCNFVDDDCDSSTDEGVLSPCGGCSPICEFDVGGEGSEPLDQDEEEQQNLEPSGNGLQLSSGQIGIPFIWIANSAEDTVSKLNTETGNEVARYGFCDDPSRTAVDLNGDGIIACRRDGRVAKIAILEADCRSTPGGMVNTSRDTSGDGQIQTSEMVTDDDCVLWNVQPDGGNSDVCSSNNDFGCARAAGVDADNHVWVGMFNSYKLHQLDGATGATLTTHTLTARPYGLAIAGDGTIWVASRSPNSLMSVHPTSGETGYFPVPSGQEVYGIAIDHNGSIWLATGSKKGALRYDPSAAVLADRWTAIGPWTTRGNTRGVAVRLTTVDGEVTGSKVFFGHHTWGACTDATGEHRMVSVVDATSASELPALNLGSDLGPVGVAIDIDGHLWSVNQCDSSATKINTETGAVLGTFDVGTGPYTYSDMTGYALRTITARAGYYRQTFEGWPNSGTTWSAIYADADLPGNGATYLSFRFRAAATEAGLNAQSWSTATGNYPPLAMPVTIAGTGRFVQIEVTLHTSDDGFVPTLFGVSALAEEQP